jgi:hypothetical protein
MVGLPMIASVRPEETMTPVELNDLMDRLEFERDVRKPPDNSRRNRFLQGWEHGASRARTYIGLPDAPGGASTL